MDCESGHNRLVLKDRTMFEKALLLVIGATISFYADFDDVLDKIVGQFVRIDTSVPLKPA